MAETYLIEINNNDELPDVIRKVNSNFRNVLYTQSNEVKKSSRSSSDQIKREITEVRQDMQSEIDQVNQDMQAMETRIEQVIANAITDAKVNLRNTLTPPVGTMMFSSSNPGNTYSNTTWTQVTQGTVLLSAGGEYSENSKWKLADSTLSSGGSLFTAYKLWRRTA